MPKVCPLCGSARFRLTARNYRGAQFKSADLYICVDCGRGFPEPVEPAVREEKARVKAAREEEDAKLEAARAEEEAKAEADREAEAETEEKKNDGEKDQEKEDSKS